MDLNPNITVAIKSYKRAGQVRTFRVAPFATIWVPESQAEDYEAHYPGRVVTIEDHWDGQGCPRKMNGILENVKTPWVLILDDDITGIGYWEDGGHVWMAPDHLVWFINHGFDLASQLGVKLWGVNQRRDEMCYRTFKPFSLLSPILGPFQAHLEPELRYDESCVTKEDYDFWLQNILHYRRTLRFDKYHYAHHHGTGLPGGLVSIRTMDLERKSIQRMTEKWGPKVFVPGGTAGGRSATGKNMLNSLVRVPIPGV